jgi:rubrerythrin
MQKPRHTHRFARRKDNLGTYYICRSCGHTQDRKPQPKLTKTTK